MPLLVSMKPRNLPASTPDEHFVGFSRMLYFQTDARISSRSSWWLPSIV
ncbi:hypothetical protein A2U01_0108801, partial [Trifolium medium]|nr:hypothetical protein [Trifolium medium]